MCGERARAARDAARATSCLNACKRCCKCGMASMSRIIAHMMVLRRHLQLGRFCGGPLGAGRTWGGGEGWRRMQLEGGAREVGWDNRFKKSRRNCPKQQSTILSLQERVSVFFECRDSKQGQQAAARRIAPLPAAVCFVSSKWFLKCCCSSGSSLFESKCF